jgi:plastocyanin
MRRGLWRVGGTAVLAAAVLFAPAGSALAEDLEIPVTIEKNRFQPAEIKVKAKTPFVLVITNKDPTPEEFESKPLKVEKVIPAGKTVKVRIRALDKGTYPFVGEYHEATAKGRIVAE